MNTSNRFADNFWDSEFLGTSGFEALSRRCKEGRQTCKELEDFFRSRSKIEEEYGQSLMTLAKRKDRYSEFGTSRTSLEAIRIHANNIGHQHQQLSKELGHLVNGIAEFRTSQKHSFKKAEVLIKKSIAKKQDQYKKTMSSKQTFEKYSLEQETVDAHVDQCRRGGSSSLTCKEMEKHLHKQMKIQSDSTKYNYQYKEDLTILEINRNQWNIDMKSMANIVERFEQDRLKFIRNEIWTYINLISCSILTIDKLNDSIREILLSINIENDLTEFVNNRKTGANQPAQIPYDANNRQTNPCRM